MSTAVDVPEAGTAGSAPPATPPPPLAALAGIVALAVGLAAAEVATAIDRDFRSPVVSVGDRVIDRVPDWLREWGIRTFGTNDKAVLVGTIVVVLVGVAAGVGMLALRRHRAWGPAAAAALALVGACAAVASPTAGLAAAVPSVLGGAAAAAAFVVLGRRAQAVDPATSTGRRRFLVGVGAAAVLATAGGVVGRSLRNRFAVAAERLALMLPLPRRPLPPPPAGVETMPGMSGLSPLFTPNDRFYRIDTALFTPNVSIDSWRLRVHGMVERELELTFDDLLRRDFIETDVTLACVSNEIGGNLVGNARWLGTRLDALLEEAGILSDADQIVGRSVDGFTAGFPVSMLDGRNAIIAIGMNGEPLPVAHGYPARLIVPGLYGYVSATKWLSEIELTRFDRFEAYWVPRGWAARAPIKTQSRIDRPNRPIPPGSAVIAGVAWAGIRGIARVEVRVDDGPWMTARLGPELAATTWRQWWLPWDATEGTHQVVCRATDGTGDTQTEERSRPDPDGATGWHTRNLVVRADA